jgi:ElaB/YqjD/DUF883 family membrane-anchored ribosome-binding protein
MKSALAQVRLCGYRELGKEKVMDTIERGEKVKNELRDNMEDAVDKARAAYDTLQQKTAAAAQATDRAVREHPYQAVGVAFGVGVLLGVLIVRSRRSED